MATNALEVRMARLEGAYEQIDKRLGGMEAELHALRVDVQSEIRSLRTDVRSDVRSLVAGNDRIDQKLDVMFRWAIGVVLANWITLMLAVLGRR